MQLLTCVLHFASIAALAAASGWSYDGEHSPAHWAHDYPDCGGEHQSPVDIVPANTELDNPGALSLDGYDSPGVDKFTLENNGHAAQVNVPGTRMILSGSMLGDTKFQLAQFHFHWGSSNDKGSEHTVDGKHYPAEMHLVHYNTKYSSLTEAIDKPDGLAVIGVFVEAAKRTEQFNSVVKNVKHVLTEGKENQIASFRVLDLLPSNTDDFYYYNGSLTTPGCYESVQWIVMREPVTLSMTQLNRFKKMRQGPNKSSARLQDNFRPVQDLNDRVVKRSFE